MKTTKKIWQLIRREAKQHGTLEELYLREFRYKLRLAHLKGLNAPKVILKNERRILRTVRSLIRDRLAKLGGMAFEETFPRQSRRKRSSAEEKLLKAVFKKK